MSIKDRIKFFENLGARQQPKPVPKVNKLFQPKNQIPKPTFNQNIKIETQKTQPKHIPQTITKQAKQVPQLPVKNQIPKHVEPQKSQIPKTSQVISQLNKKDISQKNQKFNAQVNETKQVQSIGKVQGLKALFQNKMPIAIQPPVMKSCFTVPTKKNQTNGEKQKIQNVQALTLKNNHVSLPPNMQSDEGQTKLSFKQKIKLAQMTFIKSIIGPPKKKQENENDLQKDTQNKQAHKNEQNIQNKSNTIQVHLPQQTYKFQEGNQKEQNKTEEQSDRLFKEALKQQEQTSNTLITGQSNHLNLATRKTMARKKRNDSQDFDDL